MESLGAGLNRCAPAFQARALDETSAFIVSKASSKVRELLASEELSGASEAYEWRGDLTGIILGGRFILAERGEP